MDRTTKRMRRIRIRSRRTKLVAGVVVAAAAVVVLAAAAFGQQGQGPAPMPKPKVEKVDLSPDPAPVDAGWEGQVGTDANLVAVQWNGDSSAQYTFEFRNADGKWLKAADSGTFDNGPDPGSKDANAGGVEITTSSRTSQARLTTAPTAVATIPSTQPVTARLRPPAVPGALSIRATAERPRK